jgi:hypothetical protein
MNFADLETIEDVRTKKIIDALQAMSEILKDKKATIDQKIEAAKVITVFDNTAMRGKVLDHDEKNLKKVDKAADRLIQQLEKMSDDEE